MSDSRRPVARLPGTESLDLSRLEDAQSKMKFTLHRTKEERRRQRLEFVYGQLPARMNASMDDVRKILEQDD